MPFLAFRQRFPAVSAERRPPRTAVFGCSAERYRCIILWKTSTGIRLTHHAAWPSREIGRRLRLEEARDSEACRPRCMIEASEAVTPNRRRSAASGTRSVSLHRRMGAAVLNSCSVLWYSGRINPADAAGRRRCIPIVARDRIRMEVPRSQDRCNWRNRGLWRKSHRER